MNPQSLNTKNYVINVSDTSAVKQIQGEVAAGTKIIIYNDSDQAAFVTAGKETLTAAWPASGDSDPKLGKVVGPKNTATFTLDKGENFIAAIQDTAGTGNLYFTLGEGI